MKKLFLGKPTVNSYLFGYVLSVIFTVLAFVLVQMHLNSSHNFLEDNLLILIIFIFALLQLVIQLIFFLHILNEDKPKWNLLFFIGTFILVLMVIISSIWIMNNLKHDMTAESMRDYIIQDEGIRTIQEKHELQN